MDAARMKEYYESDRKHFLNSVRRYYVIDPKLAKLKALKDDHDASMLVMGSNTTVLPGQDTGDVKERQAKEMQSPEHPHTSGDDETGVDRSSGESECSTEPHANPSGSEQNSKACSLAPGSST